jgi:hypothetical protein
MPATAGPTGDTNMSNFIYAAMSNTYYSEDAILNVLEGMVISIVVAQSDSSQLEAGGEFLCDFN